MEFDRIPTKMEELAMIEIFLEKLPQSRWVDGIQRALEIGME